MKNNSYYSVRTIVFLCLLFLFSFFIRSINFSTSIQFDSDFGRDSLFALRIMRGDLTLLGPQASVGGFYLAPLYYYLIAFVYSLAGLSPAAMTVVFLTMGAMTIVIGFLALKKHVSTLAAFLFASMSLTHPGLVHASRSATNQPMMPLVTVIFVFVYFEAIKRQKKLWWFLSGIVFGLFFHVHFSALLVLPAVGLLLLLQINGTFKEKIIGIVLFGCAVIVMVSPILIFDTQHQFITSKAFLSYVQASALGEGIADNHPHLGLLGKFTRIAWFSVQNTFLAIVVFVIALCELVVHRKHIRENQRFLALVLCSLVSIAVLLKYNGYLYDYYLLIPMTILLMTVASLLSLLRAKWFALLFGLVVFGTNWSMLRYPFAYRILPNLSKVSTTIQQDIEATGSRNFTIFKDSSDQLTGIGYEYRFLLTRDGYEPMHEQRYEQADVLYYIQEEGNKDPLVSTNWETTQFGATKKELVKEVELEPWKVMVWRLTK